MARAQALRPSDLGHWSSAFYGPRAEAPLVGVVATVVPVDATAMYSLVSGLLETWALLRAASIRTEDVTRPVRSVLARPDLLALCFQGRFWREHIGVTLVELEDIEGSVLPVRARFDPQAADPRLAVTPFFYDGRLWYTLPDVIASVLLSGIVPRVRRAIRLHGAGHQAGLREVRLRGGRVFDPVSEDLFVALANERQRIRRDASLAPVDRERAQGMFKTLASTHAFGSPAVWTGASSSVRSAWSSTVPTRRRGLYVPSSPKIPGRCRSHRSRPRSRPERASCSQCSTAPER